MGCGIQEVSALTESFLDELVPVEWSVYSHRRQQQQQDI